MSKRSKGTAPPYDPSDYMEGPALDIEQLSNASNLMLRQLMRRRILRNAIIVAIITVLAGWLLEWLQFRMVVMRGCGMADTLSGGDIVLCEHALAIAADKYMVTQRGDVALIQVNEDTSQYQIARRVIAKSGDVLYINLVGRVTLNGQELEEPYAAYRDLDDINRSGGILGGSTGQRSLVDPRWEEVVFPLTVPEGMLFVLADDRSTFDDSRSKRFGLVREKDVVGIVNAIVWPLHRARVVREGGWFDAYGELFSDQ